MAISDDELISIPFKFIVYAVAGLPSFALFICIVLSIVLHWDEATRTHCGVTNWFPSVSAAVASYSPERYIWRLFIALHGTPRLGIAIAFRNLLITSPLRPFSAVVWFPIVVNIACAINLLENIFLLLLTSVSSVDDYFLHKASFIGFAFCAMVYMYVSTWLFDYSGRRRTTSLGEKSFQYKVLCTTVSTVSLVLAMYFFYRHNAYCEPGMYTMFALSEYAVVIFNILFHSTLYFDFHGKRFTLLPELRTTTRRCRYTIRIARNEMDENDNLP